MRSGALAIGAATLLLVVVSAGSSRDRARAATTFLDYSDVFVVSPSGAGAQALTDFPGPDGQPAWSPDSTKIAFVSTRGNTCFGDIFVMDADGASPTQLTDELECDQNPAWSPNGSTIAFSSGFGASQIYTINADGSSRTQLTHDAYGDSEPSWSPDGSKIAFTGYRAGNSDIIVMDADGANQKGLTATQEYEVSPAWSPDGTRIVFTRHTGTTLLQGDLFLMNTDGSGVVRLTDDIDTEMDAAWSPDGAKIAFTRLTPMNISSLAVINADGSGLTELPMSDAEGPSWSPDGRWIAYDAQNGNPVPPPSPPPGGPPVRCRVPKVVGKPLALAKPRIRGAHCSVGRIRRVRSKRVGRVLKQTPRAGALRARGTSVNLVVGKRGRRS
jgi:TolB protein